MIATMLLCLFLSTSARGFGTACREGNQFAEIMRGSSFGQSNQVVADELLPDMDKQKRFDPISACERVLNGARERSVPVEFLLDERVHRNERENAQVDSDDWIFVRSEQIVEGASTDIYEVKEEEVLDSRLERCVVQDAPQSVVLENRLSVEVVSLPSEPSDARSCLGHSGSQKYHHPDDAWRAEKELRHQFANDPSIASYDVWLERGKMGHRDRVVWEYQHHRNHPTCDHYQTISVLGTEKNWEERDCWSLDRDRFDVLLADPNATLVGRVCIEGEGVREVNGKTVQRPLWVEEYRFFIFDPNAKSNCPFFRDQRCDLVGKTCLEEGVMGCVTWEFLFRCWKPSVVTRSASGPFHSEGEEVYLQEPNGGFSDVVTKLAVFADIKDQIVAADVPDVSKLELFPGGAQSCSKSVAGEVMYDCCFTMGGLAKDLQLAQCSPEEVHLADLRERGLCHYVGSHSEKFLEMWKSRTIHTFCCFSSKLARVLQEQGRDQLHLGWGSSDSPICRGLSSDEISQIDFSELDLSELYELPPDGFTPTSDQKFADLRSRIQRRIEEVGDAAA